tara:strand:- start:1007 stop:1714 length:708 start_codon:yes stop_codon:yes gene_type:complete
MSKTLCIKRIIKDINDLEKNNLETHNIFFNTVEDDIYKLKVLIIGTTDTPYENGFYFFDINIPEDYPFAPPKVKFCTSNNKTRFNPNLYVDGKVCLSLINTWSGPKWTSCNSLTSVLLSLQAIVFIKNPLHNEPGFEYDNSIRCTNYNKILCYENINTGIIKMIKHIPNGFDLFESIIIQYFFKNYNNIITFIEKQTQEPIIVDAKIYSMKQQIDYKNLKKRISDLYECIVNKNK